MNRIARSTREAFSRSLSPARRFLVAGALGSALAAGATAQRLVVSTTLDPGGGPGGGWEDGDLLAAGGGRIARPYYTGTNWQATIGFAPTDVDGFAFQPGQRAGDGQSLAFSFQADIGGYLDGDVLALAPLGGMRILVFELALVAGLGLPNANVDVDALDFDDQGRLLFSLQSDLAGTVLGDVKDGDVLRLEADGTVSRVLTEAEIDLCLQAATGTSSKSGDVQGIDWVAGELWVAVQSPSSQDGGVLSCGPVPTVIADEASLGLGGAEIDALSLLPAAAELPVADLAPRTAAPGEFLEAEFHGPPNSLHLVLMSGGVGWVDFTHAPGFGAWFLDPLDPWLASFFSAPAPSLVTLDANGEYRTRYALPSAPVWGPGWVGEDGWTFQMVSLDDLTLAAPVRVGKR